MRALRNSRILKFCVNMNLKRIRLILLVLTLFFYFSPLLGDEIGKISFQQTGSYIFPEEMLLYNFQSREGMDFDQKILDEDIKRLYSTGQFLDITSETTKAADGKIDVLIKIVAKPRIKAIIFKGNRKYSDKKLKDKAILELNAPLDDKKLQKSLSNLREFYHNKGYYSAIITPSTEDAEEGYANVIFNISENLRRKVSSVTFVGNTVYSSWYLRRMIATQHSYWNWLFDIGLLDENEMENDKQRLRELYWNQGFLDFKVKGTDIKEEEDPEYINVTFYLEEEEPYIIGEVAITGNKKFSTDELLPLVGLKTDMTYDNRLEKKDVEEISKKYYPLGYADFICNTVRVPDFSTHTVDIEYRIEEGNIYTVRNLNITGNHNTKDKVIRREMALHPGDPLDHSRIKASESRLMGMGYFDKVNIVTVDTEEPGSKDVNVKVEEKNTASFSVGAGFSDTDSLVGIAEVSQSNFDLFNPSNYFIGGGQRVKLQAQYGLERSDFLFSFTEPWLMDMPLRLDLGGFYHDREYEDWSERRGGGEFALTKRFMEFNNISMGYRLESVRIYDMDDDLSNIFQREEGTDTVSTMSLTLARDTRNSLLEPTSGYLIEFLNELTGKFMGASHNYYRLEGKASRYYSFINDAFVLHTGAQFGHVNKIDSGKMVPIYERYFLGGGDSLRGFPYREVSPADDNDDPYGGESMLLGNIELTHPIYDFIRGAVFMDAGNVWKKSGGYRLDDINVGAGYGLRIKVPQLNAPVRLDLAYPVVKDQDHLKRKLRFHFNIGFTW